MTEKHHLPASARAALDGIVNDICRDADLSFDGTAALIRQTDAQSDYLYGNAERLIRHCPVPAGEAHSQLYA